MTGTTILSPLQKKIAKKQFSRGDFWRRKKSPVYFQKSPVYLTSSLFNRFSCAGRVHWTSHFLQGNRNTTPCITGHPVSGRKVMENEFFIIKVFLLLQKAWNTGILKKKPMPFILNIPIPLKTLWKMQRVISASAFTNLKYPIRETAKKSLVDSPLRTLAPPPPLWHCGQKNGCIFKKKHLKKFFSLVDKPPPLS